jgi:hypothetical protein
MTVAQTPETKTVCISVEEAAKMAGVSHSLIRSLFNRESFERWLKGNN